MTYYKVYNPKGYDENLFYPLFHCHTYSDTHFPVLNRAKNVLKKHPDGIIIECDTNTPNIYKNHNNGKTYKSDGGKWRSK